MDAIEHATLADLLIRARGGVKRIVEDRLCRVSSSQLYAYADPTSGQFMPTDVVFDLEDGIEPIYSRALLERRKPTGGSGPIVSLLTAASEETEEAAALQRQARLAEGRGASPRDRRRICKEAYRLRDGADRIIEACAEAR